MICKRTSKGARTGEYAAFLLATTDGMIDTLGVRPDLRRRGIGAAMVVRTLRLSNAAGTTELRSLVATTNPASLRLHEQFGFREYDRGRVWQQNLATVAA